MAFLLCFIISCYVIQIIASQDNRRKRHRNPHHQQEAISLDDFPNPLVETSMNLCGRQRKSLICDPHQFLNPTIADSIDEILFNATESNLVWCPTIVKNDQFIQNPKPKTRANYNGLQIGVAIISSFNAHPHSRLRRSDDIAKKSQVYAKSIHDQWGVGESGCNNAIMIFINIYDRYLYVSTGSAIKDIISDSFVTGFIIPRYARGLMRESKYGEAVKFIVETIIDVLKHSDDLSQHALYQSYIKLSKPSQFMGILNETWFIIILVSCGIAFLGYKFYSERDYRDCKRKLARLHAQKQATKFASASCPICLEDFAANGNDNETDVRATAILICGHKYCKDCLDSWFASQSVANQKCPICRHDRDDWSMVDGGDTTEQKQDTEDGKQDTEDGKQDEKRNEDDDDDDGDYGGTTHSKTSTSDTFYDNDNVEQTQQSNVNQNQNGFGFRRRNRGRYRRGMNMNDWMFQQELLFRMSRIRHRYPRYVSDDMVNRWSRPDYSGRFTNDDCFVRANPNYRAPTSRSGSSWSSGRGSGFSFGGGSSSGGGGGGGSW